MNDKYDYTAQILVFKAYFVFTTAVVTTFWWISLIFCTMKVRIQWIFRNPPNFGELVLHDY